MRKQDGESEDIREGRDNLTSLVIAVAVLVEVSSPPFVPPLELFAGVPALSSVSEQGTHTVHADTQKDRDGRDSLLPIVIYQYRRTDRGKR